MILADKITEERKRNGWSQEELAEKLGVSRQAVSKWESAGSVPDLQRVIQLAELFGVSTDYLLRDEMEQAEVVVYSNMETEETQPLRRVSMEEANEFLDRKRKDAPTIANAVSMCILCPTLLVLLGVLAEDARFHVSEAFVGVVGCIFLFGMIAAAVFMLITCGIREKSMEFLEKENFETAYGVSGMVKERSRSYEPVFTRGIAVGVVLCIISVVPLVIAGVMDAPDVIMGVLVVLLLCMIAVAVNMFIRVGMIKSSFDTLLQEGEFTREEKNAKRKTEEISSVYWCLMTAIYLGWSFWTMRWDVTWIIWPVAGVLYAAISGIMRLVIGAEK